MVMVLITALTKPAKPHLLEKCAQIGWSQLNPAPKGAINGLSIYTDTKKKQKHFFDLKKGKNP